MKKRMFAALLAVSMMIGMTACGSDNSSAGNSASGSSTETAKSDNAGSDSSYDVLNVGTMALTCGIPVLYAEEQGYFKDAGLNVNIEIFATGAPINEAIAANQIDVAVSGFASVYSLANADCSWVADVNTTGGIICTFRFRYCTVCRREWIDRKCRHIKRNSDFRASWNCSPVYDRILCRKIWINTK